MNSESQFQSVWATPIGLSCRLFMPPSGVYRFSIIAHYRDFLLLSGSPWPREGTLVYFERFGYERLLLPSHYYNVSIDTGIVTFSSLVASPPPKRWIRGYSPRKGMVSETSFRLVAVCTKRAHRSDLLTTLTPTKDHYEPLY